MFGYVYEEDNDHGLFSCIINNADVFLSLTLSLINSVLQFEQKQMSQSLRTQSAKGKGKRGKKKRGRGGDGDLKERNEEREEFEAIR